MHSFTKAMLLGMAVAATARPQRTHAKRDTCMLNTVSSTSPSDIEASINQWNLDVTNVNNFLNDVASGVVTGGSTLQQRAMEAFNFAQDEPCQLQTLANIVSASQGELVSSARLAAVKSQCLMKEQNTIAYQCAIGDLQNVFGTHVLTNLQNIISNPNSTAVVSAAVSDINVFRCCNVLPDASILWLDSAVFAGISNEVPTCAGRPNACSSISCQESCQVDNGDFGATC
jgi:hypothetical protein